MLNKDPELPTQAWSQEELNLLHEMEQEYARMQWLKKKAWMWGVWLVGLPTGVLMVWEPLARLWKLIKGS